MSLTENYDCAPLDTASQTGGDEPAAPRNTGEHRSRRNTGVKAWMWALAKWLFNWGWKFLKKNWPFVLLPFFLYALHVHDCYHATLQTKQVAELKKEGDFILDSCCNMKHLVDKSNWSVLTLDPAFAGLLRLTTYRPNSQEECQAMCQEVYADTSEYAGGNKTVNTLLHLLHDPTFLMKDDIFKVLYTYFELIFLVAYSVVMYLVCTKYKVVYYIPCYCIIFRGRVSRRHSQRFQISFNLYVVLLACFVYCQVYQYYYRETGRIKPGLETWFGPFEQVATVHEWQQTACQQVQDAPQALQTFLIDWGITDVLDANCKLD